MTTSGEQHGGREARRTEEPIAEPVEDWTDEDDARLGAGLPPASPTVDAALTALFEAGPEAAEHLLKAAQELLLAAKAVVEAGERAVEAHRSAADAPDPAPGEEPPARRGRVRRIDLA